jgi:hypothetical protein
MNARNDVVAQQVADAIAPENTKEREKRTDLAYDNGIRSWRFGGYSVPLCAKLGDIMKGTVALKCLTRNSRA